MKHLLLFSTIIFTQFINATTWQVGSAHSYTMPSQVSSLVQNGDTVEIDAGIYSSDVAHWTANNLLLKGVNGFAKLFSGGLSFGDKAIWVIGGNNNTIENIEFAQATSTSHNGAGIRQEGHNLIVTHCYFHNNEDGILAGTVTPSNIKIEYSEFGYNGFGDGYTHNLYINNIDTLIFQYNYSHHAIVGHELKSRAHVNFIFYNRISDEDSGYASRSIDLPNGGVSYIIGNVIEQGPLSQNSNIIGYGLEGLTNPSPHEVYAINNTIVNDRGNGSFFQFQPGTSLFKGYNNIIAGNGAFVTGTIPTIIDTPSNIINSNIASFAFVDAMNYDYRLTNASNVAIDAGINPGSANNVSLSPDMEYIHPDSSATRCISNNLDAGAFEFCLSSGISEIINDEFYLYPNPATDKLFVSTPNEINEKINVSILNLSNEVLKEYFITKQKNFLNLDGFCSGVYLIKIEDGNRQVYKKLIISN